MNLETFKKTLAKGAPKLMLILGKEIDEPVSLLLKTWGRVLTWDAQTFDPDAFAREVETIPFLGSEVFIHIKEIDQIKETRGIAAFAQRPSPWVSLLVSGTALPASHALAKAFEAKGLVWRVAELKPWEKEGHFTDWLMHRAAEEGVTLVPEAARALVSHIGCERALLLQELEKLICFVGKRRQITPQDVGQLTAALTHETLWQLGDAVLLRDRLSALTIAHRLLREGTVFFALVAGLRTQLRTALSILDHYHEGGEAAVRKAFPYLKGGMAQKKIKAVTTFGARRLRKTLVALFDCEVQAKNVSTSQELLLDLLIAKI